MRVLATVLVALALGVTVALAAEIVGSPSSPATPRVAFVTGNFEIANSNADAAIFTVGDASPGSSAGGQVTITNSGDIPGPITLSKSDIVDEPGPAGRALSEIADVSVSDVTQPLAPITVYAGRLVAMPDLALGTFAPSEGRTYAFTVSLPDSAPDSVDINAYQSASLRLGYVWAGTADAPAEPPPPAQESPSDSEPVPDQATTETTTTPADDQDSAADATPTPGGGDSSPGPQATGIAGPAGGSTSGGAADRSARSERTTRADRRNRGRQDPKPTGSIASDAKPRQERSGLAKAFQALKKVVKAAAEKGSFPLLLLLLIGAFFALQSWLDRRDPKLALAPVDAEPTRTFG